MKQGLIIWRCWNHWIHWLFLSASVVMGTLLLVMKSFRDSASQNAPGFFAASLFFFIMVFAGLPRLVEVTWELRALAVPRPGSALRIALATAGLVWAIWMACALLLTGIHQWHLAVAATFLAITFCASAFSTYWGIHMLLFQTYFFGRFLSRIEDWPLIWIVVPTALLAIWAVFTACRSWERSRFDSTPGVVTSAVSKATAYRRYVENRKPSSDPWINLLTAFGFARLPAALKRAGQGLSLMAIAIGIVGWWNEMTASGLVYILQAAGVAVAFACIVQSEQRMFDLYLRNQEREFIGHLPRLPSPAIQSRYLRRSFWLLAAVPALLFQLSVPGLAFALQASYSVSFALVTLGSHLLAAMICEARLQRCAADGVASGGDAVLAWLVMIGGALFWVAGFAAGSLPIVAAVMVALPLLILGARWRYGHSRALDGFSLVRIPQR